MAVTQVSTTVNSALEPNTQEINTLKVRMTEQEGLLGNKLPEITSIGVAGAAATAGVASNEARQTTLESTFNALVINAGSSNAEIVAARGSAVDLSTRLGGVDTQLADSTKQINVAKYATIEEAIAVAVSLKSTTMIPILYFPYKAGGFSSAVPITIPSGISVEMDSTLTYTGALDNTPFLTIGDTAVSLGTRLKLDVVRNTQSAWTSEESVGIKLINCNACNIEIIKVNKFTIGVQCSASAAGWSYNNIILGTIQNNKIGVECNSVISGWVNENLFSGGRFYLNSTTNVALSRYGVRLISKDGTYPANNNNVFLKPSFELGFPNLTGGAEAIPIVLDGSVYNSFIKIRNEGNSADTVRVTGEATNNEVTVGYGSGQIADSSTYPTTTIIMSRESMLPKINTLLFLVDRLHLKACYADGSTTVNIPRLHVANSSNLNIASSGTNITINNKYLEVSGAIALGVYVETTRCKKFVIKNDINVGYGGRIKIRCFDVTGTILTDVSPNHPYIKSASNDVLTYAASFTCYSTGADGNINPYLFFTVGVDVSYIEIMWAAGTATMQIRALSVYGEYDASTWLGYEEIVEGVNLATVPPTIGTWKQGRKVLNAVPVVGQPKGWICTVAGTPGTWVSEGNL